MQKSSLTYPSLEKTEQFLQAVANSLRLEILFYLFEQPTCVCDLAKNLHHRQPCISQHLMVLRNAGIVSCRREGWKRYYYISSKKANQLLELFLKNCQADDEMIE